MRSAKSARTARSGTANLEPMGDPEDYDGEDFDDPDERGPVPLDRHEAARVRADLDDLAAFRSTFEPEGFKGVSMFCADCVEEHFYGWDMLAGNLKALLESGEIPVHEPAFDPRPDEYVDWEYAQGYLDGLADAGSPALPALATPEGGCAFCGATLPQPSDDVAYCPACGSNLGPTRIARALLDRGWSAQEVAELLRAALIPPLRTLPPSSSA